MKAALYEHVRNVYPEYLWVTTRTDHSNEAIVDINRRLGFEVLGDAGYYSASRELLGTLV